MASTSAQQRQASAGLGAAIAESKSVEGVKPLDAPWLHVFHRPNLRNSLGSLRSPSRQVMSATGPGAV